MSAVVSSETQFLPVEREIGAFSNASNFETAQRMAQALTTSSLVPKHFQGNSNLGNAVIALEIAQRIGASPLLVMQNLAVVHGQPSWSAKFLIATFNQCGRFSAIKYEWKGEKGKDDYGCRALSTEKRTGNEIEGPWIDWALVNAEGWHAKNGSKWKTMPDKMFMYRAAAWMIDLYAPEISMGMPTAEDAADYIDVNPVTGEVIGASVNSAAQLNESIVKTAGKAAKTKPPKETTPEPQAKEPSATYPKIPNESKRLAYAELNDQIKLAQNIGEMPVPDDYSHLPLEQQEELAAAVENAISKLKK